MESPPVRMPRHHNLRQRGRYKEPVNVPICQPPCADHGLIRYFVSCLLIHFLSYFLYTSLLHTHLLFSVLYLNMCSSKCSRCIGVGPHLFIFSQVFSLATCPLHFIEDIFCPGQGSAQSHLYSLQGTDDIKAPFSSHPYQRMFSFQCGQKCYN